MTNIRYANGDDKNIVLQAVGQSGRQLQYASARLKNDKDVVLAAVQENGWALEFADSSLKNDKDVVLAAIKQNKRALEFADSNLKKDRDFVLAAVQQNGWMLEFADANLKKDKDVVLAAVQQNKAIFDYLSRELGSICNVIKIKYPDYGYEEDKYLTKCESVKYLHDEISKSSCFGNFELKIMKHISNAPYFLPSLELIDKGLKSEETKKIFESRQDEWIAKIEEEKLKKCFGIY